MSLGALVTVRLKSRRLPQKALRPLAGRPVLSHLIDRLEGCFDKNRIILCTSFLSSDAPLVDFARQRGIPFHLGSPDDVLARLAGAAERFGLSAIISCTGDNPFVDTEHVRKLSDAFLTDMFDYGRYIDLPLGAFAYCLRTEALLDVCRRKSERDTEIWGPYFTATGRYRCAHLEAADPEVSWPDLRLTIDTPADLALAEALTRALGSDRPFGVREIVRYCRRHPEVAAINGGITQRIAPAIDTGAFR